MSVQTTITRQDPEIEAYRLGLLSDVQGLIRNQMFGQQVQNLRAQGLSDADIAQQLSTGQGVEGEEGYVPGEIYSAEDIAKVPVGASFAPPGYQVAGFTSPQTTAIALGEAGIGSYQPFLMQGLKDVRGAAGGQRGALYDVGQATQLGTGLGQQAFGALGSIGGAQSDLKAAGQFGKQGALAGIAGLAGGAGQFDPTGIGAFMSPYEDIAVQQALRDLQRQGDIQEQALEAQAVQQGAFGGSRQAVAEQELQRNVMEQQGRTAAQMRQAGFESAAARAQQAFEQARARQLQSSQLMGQLGQAGASSLMQAAQQAGQLGLGSAQAQGQLALGLGQLGQSGATGASSIAGQLGQLGIQTAGLGELGQTMRQRDISNLMQLGGMSQAQAQAVLDAQRMTGLQSYQQPFQQLGFLSDVYAGIPTSQSTQTMTSGSNASPFMQAASLGIAGLSAATGAQKAGIL